MELSDELLVGQAQENDPAAFAQLVERYKSRIYGAAYRMMGNHSDADDVAQETFIRAYKGLKKFKGHSSLSTWLYRIMINCCMDLLRKRKQRGGETAPPEAADVEEWAAGDRVASGGTSLSDNAQLNELRSGITEALESLPIKHRMAFVLHEFDGMPHQDVARAMGCSVGTARSRLHYARLKMQQKLRRFVE